MYERNYTAEKRHAKKSAFFAKRSGSFFPFLCFLHIPYIVFTQVIFISHVISPVLYYYSHRTCVNSNISIDFVLSGYVTNGTKTEYHSGLSTYLKFVLCGKKYL
jgi:hypothetical protein